MKLTKVLYKEVCYFGSHAADCTQLTQLTHRKGKIYKDKILKGVSDGYSTDSK